MQKTVARGVCCNNFQQSQVAGMSAGARMGGTANNRRPPMTDIELVHGMWMYMKGASHWQSCNMAAKQTICDNIYIV